MSSRCCSVVARPPSHFPPRDRISTPRMSRTWTRPPRTKSRRVEEEILDRATAARKAEIETLKNLEGLALGVRRSGADTKWRELASLLGEIFTAGGIAEQIAEADVPYGAGDIPRPDRATRGSDIGAQQLISTYAK